jgi:hypothetical protein
MESIEAVGGVGDENKCGGVDAMLKVQVEVAVAVDVLGAVP